MTPPATDELEVSLFGTGFGECVVVHLGLGEWLVIDSCRDPVSKKPAALWYLDELGVDVATAVKSVVATHWHDDHIEGLSEIVEGAENTKFACTSAFHEKDFQSLYANFFGTTEISSTSGISELSSVLAQLSSRSVDSPAKVTLAGPGTVVWERFGNFPALVRALSPSTYDVVAGIGKLRDEGLFANNTPRRRLPPLSPNDTSVVLTVNIGNAHLLLGADLEEVGDCNRGWQAIVGRWDNDEGQHEYFKIPHHGSSNGHCARVWDEMLIRQPHAALTSFRHMLPTDADIIRVKARAGEVCLTSPRFRRRSERSSGMDSIVGGLCRRTWAYNRSLGHVQARRKLAPGSQWEAKCFEPAARL